MIKYLLIILIISFAAFIAIQNMVKTNPQQTSTIESKNEQDNQFKMFNNEKYRFSLKYPSEWKVWEYSTPEEPNLVEGYDLIINPADSAPDSGNYPRYFHLRISKGDINNIKNVHRVDMNESEIDFHGFKAYKYVQNYETGTDEKLVEISFLNNGLVFNLYTQFFDERIESILQSFSFK